MINLTITTSEALNAAQKVSIEKRMQKKYGEITVSYRIDDALIGGIMIFDGDKVYDGSIRAQLVKIKEKMENK